MLELELSYYKNHQSEITKGHLGEFVVIHNRKVIDYYPSAVEAYIEAEKQFEPGTFLIQECLLGDESFTQHFYSPVVTFS